jgi:hypothetical protein
MGDFPLPENVEKDLIGKYFPQQDTCPLLLLRYAHYSFALRVQNFAAIYRDAPNRAG